MQENSALQKMSKTWNNPCSNTSNERGGGLRRRRRKEEEEEEGGGGGRRRKMKMEEEEGGFVLLYQRGTVGQNLLPEATVKQCNYYERILKKRFLFVKSLTMRESWTPRSIRRSDVQKKFSVQDPSQRPKACRSCHNFQKYTCTFNCDENLTR